MTSYFHNGDLFHFFEFLTTLARYSGIYLFLTSITFQNLKTELKNLNSFSCDCSSKSPICLQMFLHFAMMSLGYHGNYYLSSMIF